MALLWHQGPGHRWLASPLLIVLNENAALVVFLLWTLFQYNPFFLGQFLLKF